MMRNPFFRRQMEGAATRKKPSYSKFSSMLACSTTTHGRALIGVLHSRILASRRPVFLLFYWESCRFVERGEISVNVLQLKKGVRPRSE